jgi:hypothetical protein
MPAVVICPILAGSVTHRHEAIQAVNVSVYSPESDEPRMYDM